MDKNMRYVGGRWEPINYRIVCDECEGVLVYTVQIQDFKNPLQGEEYAEMMESHGTQCQGRRSPFN